MASTVLTGTGNISYTNNTGQNARLIIYALSVYWTPNQLSASIAQSFLMIINGINFPVGVPPTTGSAYLLIGKGVATSMVRNASGSTAYNLSLGGNGSAWTGNTGEIYMALPTEFVLPPGGTFTTQGTPVGNPPTVNYNILVIPENG